YAVIDDGFNAPVASADSVPFTPNFAVQGQVANQNNHPEGGWAVFLDYNNNNIQDANEPGTKTNSGGFYSFTRTFADPDLGLVPATTPFRVVLTALAAAAVPDADFETPEVKNDPSAFRYSPTDSPWTFTSAQIPGDGAGLVANGSAFGNADAPVGNQAAFLQRTGSIRQAVSLAAGTYVLSFLAAQRPSNQQTFQVLVDGIEVGTFQPAGSSYQAYTTGSFTVTTAGSHTLEFLGTNSTSPDNSA